MDCGCCRRRGLGLLGLRRVHSELCRPFKPLCAGADAQMLSGKLAGPVGFVTYGTRRPTRLHSLQLSDLIARGAMGHPWGSSWSDEVATVSVFEDTHGLRCAALVSKGR